MQMLSCYFQACFLLFRKNKGFLGGEIMRDIDIARAATTKPIQEIGKRLSISDTALKPYGHDKAKIDLGWLDTLPEREDAKPVSYTHLRAHET